MNTLATTSTRSLRHLLTGSIAVTFLAVVAIAGPPFAGRAPSGKSLIVPREAQSKGTVYYALPGRDPQVYFESDAPLEDIKGQSKQSIGYAVATQSGSALVAGEWHVPVESLKTGIDLRDEHLASSDWLNAEEFPNVVFQLKSVRDAKSLKQTSAFSTYSVTLVGDMTVHGVTKEMTIPNTSVTFMRESEKTRARAAGDLLAIRTKYTITLSDFDISHSVIGNKVANTIEVDTRLIMSTVPPEKQ